MQTPAPSIEEKLAEMTDVAESLQSVAQEQKVLIDGLTGRANSLRVERDKFERKANRFEAEIVQLKSEILSLSSAKTASPPKED